MSKKNFSRVFVLIMIMLTIEKSVSVAYGAEIVQTVETEEKNYFEESKENYEYTELKIEEEKENVTGNIDKEIENHLNEGGMFDIEIDRLDEQLIDELEYINDIEDIKVYTEFVEVTEEENACVSEDNYKELNAKEINEMMAEVYYDEDITDETEDNSIVDDVLEIVGLKPVNVYADSDNGNEESSTYMKRSVLVYPVKHNNVEYFRIYYQNTWIKMPVNRMVDTISMRWDDIAAFYENSNSFTRNNTNAKVYYVYYEGIYSRSQGRCVSYQTKNLSYNLSTNGDLYTLNGSSVKLPVDHYCMMPGGMVASVDLMDDGTVPYTDDLVKHTEVDTIIISLSAYVKKSNVNKNEMHIEAHYWHTQSKQKLNIKCTNISFSSKEEFILDSSRFVLSNMNCVKYYDYAKDVGGGKINYTYVFK